MHELARDLIAFGSIPFLALTVIRVSLLHKPYYPFEIVAASAVFLGLMAAFKAEMRSGLGFIMLVFVSLYYHDALFAVFASLVYIGMIWALFYLKRGKGRIIKGIAFGLAGVLCALALVRMVFPPS